MAEDQNLADRAEKAPEGYAPASSEQFQRFVEPAISTPSLSNEALSRRAYSALGLGSLSEPYAEITRRQAAAEGDVARAQQAQKVTEAEGKYQAERKYAQEMRSRYLAAEPTLMSKPPQFKVTKDTEEGLTGMAALMTVGGMIIGSKGMTSGVNAMNAMTGVMKGYQEGNQARIDFETKKFEKELDNWKTVVQQTRDSLARYEKLASVDLNEATAKAARDAAAQGQNVIAAQIQQKGLTQTRADMDKMVDETRRVSQKLRDAIQEATGGGGSRATLAERIGVERAARTAEKDIPKQNERLESIANVRDLIEMAKDPQIGFGELQAFKNSVGNLVQRNVGDSGTELGRTQSDALIDEAAKANGLSPQDANVLFYKKAIFTALELERAARGGSILPVAVMKTLGPLLDPKKTTKESYIAILKDRANDVARATGYDPATINSALGKIESYRYQFPTEGEPSSAAPAAPATGIDKNNPLLSGD